MFSYYLTSCACTHTHSVWIMIQGNSSLWLLDMYLKSLIHRFSLSSFSVIYPLNYLHDLYYKVSHILDFADYIFILIFITFIACKSQWDLGAGSGSFLHFLFFHFDKPVSEWCFLPSLLSLLSIWRYQLVMWLVIPYECPEVRSYRKDRINIWCFHFYQFSK